MYKKFILVLIFLSWVPPSLAQTFPTDALLLILKEGQGNALYTVSLEELRKTYFLQKDVLENLPGIASWIASKPDEHQALFSRTLYKNYLKHKLFDFLITRYVDHQTTRLFSTSEYPLYIPLERFNFAEAVIFHTLKEKIYAFIDYAEFNAPIDPALEDQINELKVQLNRQWTNKFEEFRTLFYLFKQVMVHADEEQPEDHLFLFSVNWNEDLSWLPPREREALIGRINAHQENHHWSENIIKLSQIPSTPQGWNQLLRRQFLQGHLLSYRIRTFNQLFLNEHYVFRYRQNIENPVSPSEMMQFYSDHFDNFFRWKQGEIKSLLIQRELFHASSDLPFAERQKVREIKKLILTKLAEKWIYYFQNRLIGIFTNIAPRVALSSQETGEEPLATFINQLKENMPEELYAFLQQVLTDLVTQPISETDPIFAQTNFVEELQELNLTKEDILSIRFQHQDLRAIYLTTSTINENRPPRPDNKLHLMQWQLLFGSKPDNYPIPVPFAMHRRAALNTFLFATRTWPMEVGIRPYADPNTQDFITEIFRNKVKREAHHSTCDVMFDDNIASLLPVFFESYDISPLEMTHLTNVFESRCHDLENTVLLTKLYRAFRFYPHHSDDTFVPMDGVDLETLDPSINEALLATELELSHLYNGSEDHEFPISILIYLEEQDRNQTFYQGLQRELTRGESLKKRIMRFMVNQFGSFGRSITERIDITYSDIEAFTQIEFDFSIISELFHFQLGLIQRDPKYTSIGLVENPESQPFFINALRFETRFGFFRSEEETLEASILFGFIGKQHRREEVIGLDDDIVLPGYELRLEHAHLEELVEGIETFFSETLNLRLSHFGNVDLVDLLDRYEEFGEEPNFVQIELSSEAMAILPETTRTFLRGKISLQYSHLSEEEQHDFSKLTIALSAGELLQVIRESENVEGGFDWTRHQDLNNLIHLQHQLSLELLQGTSQGMSITYSFYINVLNGLRLNATYSYIEDNFPLVLEERYRTGRSVSLGATLYITPNIYLESWVNFGETTNFDIRLKVNIIEMLDLDSDED